MQQLTRVEINWRPANRQRILRVRYGKDDWREYETIDDVPAEVRERLPKRVIESFTLTYAIVDPDPEPPRRSRRHSKLYEQHAASRSSQPRELRIEQPWFNGCLVMMLSIGIPYFWYLTYQEFSSNPPTHFSMRSFTLLCSTGMTYFALATLLNHSLIEIKDGYLTVVHKPLPWFLNHKIPISEITQLMTRFRLSRSESSYRVYVQTRSSGTFVLLHNIQTEGEARSIERAIERHLGLEDYD